tara:strand:+ start:317 stop:2923 length:2607 start_codon:yes stop_codon:yes gene_type:complete
MAKRRKRGLTRPVTIPIRTLSSGVGRQAPSKRLPTEAENLDNCFVTLEKSVEKRNGFQIVPRSDSDHDGLELFNEDGNDFLIFWLQVSDRLRYLLMLNFKASDNDSQLVYLYKLTSSGLAHVPFTYEPTDSERAYLTFGNNIYTARESLRIVNVGANILILNKNVSAGFSSGEEGYKFDLNGIMDNTVVDVKGKADTYETTVLVDPEGKAVPWNEFESWLIGDEFIYSNQVRRQVGADLVTPPANGWEYDEGNSEFLRNTSFIDVRDYSYPRPDDAHLGQSMVNLSNIRFPPLASDVTAHNGAASKIGNNYPTIGDGNGNGKVYYLASSFGGITPGYYRVKSRDERPYLHKILTPDSSSRLDEDRMPHKLFLSSEGAWEITAIDWDPRTGGTNDTNPGISVFKDGDGVVQQVPLGSMAFYRDRLFISASDTIFSSTMGDYTDFWIEDPSNIVATDPVDIQASANKYTPIISMIPFSDFLFINTDSDTQYELLGSENQITPFTAELAPTAFYSTALMVEPQLMGSQVYFYGRNRMYLYFSSRVNNINKAVEVSAHCPQYLPSNFSSPSVAASRDTIFVVDEDQRNHVYGYTNRFSGDQVVQNAFFRFILPEDVSVYNVQEFDDNLYMLITIPTISGGDRFTLVKMPLGSEDYNKPRIDLRTRLVIDSVGNDQTDPNAVFDSSTNLTTFTLPISDPNINEAILYSGWGNDNYARLIPTIVSSESTDDTTSITVLGDYTTLGGIIHFGRSFTMTVELSPQFQRDDGNNVIDGVLNMRTIHLRHANTGDYRIEATRRNRDPVVSTFNIQEVDSLSDPLPLEIYEKDGEFVAQVFGFGAETSISIISDYPTPVNITQMEIKGKFKSIHSTSLT